MIFKRLALSLLVSLLVSTLYAQMRITGRVSDSKSKPLAFVSVALFRDSSLLMTTASDEQGSFRISYNYKPNEIYSIKFSTIGYRPFTKDFTYSDTFSFKIVLQEEEVALENVTVTAVKPLITRKADRYIINVENSFLANSSSGLDLLQKSPGIWVDNNGRIRIRGNQPVLVMINDIVLRMSEDELTEYLRSLKSEDISRIEVINTPPSEFEASGAGGIIHIILKKTRKTGLNGSLNTRYVTQGKRPLFSSGASLDYKIKSLLLFASYSYTKDKSYYYATSDIIYPDISIYNSYTERNNNNKRQQYRAGLVYDFSTNQSLGIQVMGNINRLVQSFETDVFYSSGSKNITGNAISSWIRKPSLTSTTLNYSWKLDSAGSFLKLIADYTTSEKYELNNFSSFYNDTSRNSIYRNSSPAATDIYSVQVDYTQPLSNQSEIKTGIKYTSVKRDNILVREDFINTDWVINKPASNHFIYNETLLMAYCSFEKILGKTSLKAGLRAEDTHVKGNSVSSHEQFKRQYFGLFPSIFILHSLNAKKSNSAYLNYSRRLERPSFSSLNPYRLQFDDYTISVGNPNLLPQYSNKVELGGSFSNNYMASIYFLKTENIVGELANPIANNIIEYQSQNFDNSTEYGINGSFQVKIFKNWEASNSLSLFSLSYRINDFKVKQTTFSGRSVHTITLKNILDINAIVDYRSPYVNANSKIAHLFTSDIGFSRKVLNGNGRIRLYCSDIFNTLRDKTTTDYNKTHIVFFQKRPTRTFSLSFSYSFSSGKKFNLKKIEQGSNDEKTRILN